MSSVQSVERAFAVLQCLAGGPAGVSEIADRVGLPKSTVSRLLSTLEHLGAVDQSEPGGPYYVGDLLMELSGGRMPTPTLTGLARPQLLGLVDEVCEAAGLSMLDDRGMVLYLDQADADNAVQIGDWTGKVLPPHSVASGLVMMAGAPAPVREAMLDGPLDALTERTMTDAKELAARLDEVRERGVAWTVGEAVDDVASVAAPIFDSDGAVIGAIHLHGPMYRFPGSRRPDELEALVLAASARITSGMYQ
jgi:DNA-binding IclR family transcriptional regulator